MNAIPIFILQLLLISALVSGQNRPPATPPSQSSPIGAATRTSSTVNRATRSTDRPPQSAATTTAAAVSTNTRSITSSLRSNSITISSSSSADTRKITSTDTIAAVPTDLPADGGAIPDPTKGGDDNNQLKYGVIAGVCVLVAVIIVAGVLAVRRHRKRNRFRDTSIETVLAAHRTLAEKRATKALPLGDNFGTSYASYGSGANTSIAKFTAIQNNSNNSSRVPSMMVRQSAVSGMEFLPPLTPFCISPERNDLQQGRRSGYQSPIPSIYGSPSPQRTALQSNQRMEPASLGQNVGGSFPASGGGQWLRNQQHRASSAYYTRNRPESGFLYYR